MLIELFSLGVTVEALRANIGWKSAISLQRGPVDLKFQVEGVAPTNHSSYQKTRLNDLSYGIKIWKDFSSLLSQFMHLADGQTDTQTDGRTEDNFLIARPRLHSMQRSKKWLKIHRYFLQQKCRRKKLVTALHGMQTRSSDENSVCLSVRLSVRLSVTRVDCDKTVERSVQIYIPYERTFSLVFWEEECLVGVALSTWNIRSTGPRWSKIADVEPIIARSASAVTPSEKSSINANRKSTTLFPMSLRWSSYVTPKSPKGGHKKVKRPISIKNALRLKKVCYKVSFCENCQRQSC